VVIGGIISSTPLTLLVLPAHYVPFSTCEDSLQARQGAIAPGATVKHTIKNAEGKSGQAKYER